MTTGTGLRRWREGKVRPIPGNSPPAQPVSRGVCSLRRVCDDPFSATPLPQLQRTILGAQYAFWKAWRNLSVRCGRTTTKPWGGTAPPPARRPRAQVEERVGRTTLCSSSAMSSDRLFLDRGARQHCPSPLIVSPGHDFDLISKVFGRCALVGRVHAFLRSKHLIRRMLERASRCYELSPPALEAL